MQSKFFALTLILISTFAQADTLPFVGKREFWFEGYDNPRVIRYILINKSGNTQLLYDYNGLETQYKGSYHSLICDDTLNDECIKILNSKKVALVDRQGKVMKDCNINGKNLCITTLNKVNFIFNR